MLSEIENKAIVLKGQGNVFFSQGNYTNAINCYNQAIEINIKFKEAWLNKALCHEKLNQHQEALDALTQAINIDSLYEKAIYNKANILISMQHYELAIETIDHYIAQDGNAEEIILLRKKCMNKETAQDKRTTPNLRKQEIKSSKQPSQPKSRHSAMSLPQQFTVAIQYGDVAAVQAIIAAGINVNALLTTGEFPRYLSHKMGELPNPINMESILNFQQAKPKFGESPLYLAASLGKLEVVDCLLKHKADVNQRENYGLTSLMVAISKGYIQVALRLLAEPNIMVNLTVQDGSTALSFACEKGLKTIVEDLIKKGADITHADKDGETSLIIAVNHKQPEIVKLLLQENVSPNQCKPNGVSPLFLAAQSNQLDVLKRLIFFGADLEKARNTDLINPLLIAASQGSMDSVFYLLACGANQAATGIDHCSVLDYAKRNNHLELYRHLVNYQKNYSFCTAENKKGIDLFKKGDYQVALTIFEPLSKQYLALYYQKTSIDLANCFYNMAECYRELGKVEDAANYLKKYYGVFIELFAETHVLTLQAKLKYDSFVKKYLSEDGSAIKIHPETNMATTYEINPLHEKIASQRLANLLVNSTPDKALIQAALRGSLYDVKILLKNGANPEVMVNDYYDIKNKCSLLYLMAEKGYRPVLNILLGARKTLGDEQSLNLQRLAAEKSVLRIEELKIKLKQNSDINQILDEEKNTPLLLTFKLGRYDLSISFIEEGANIWDEDIHGNDVLIDLCPIEIKSKIFAAKEKTNKMRIEAERLRAEAEQLEKLSNIEKGSSSKISLWNPQFKGLKSLPVIKKCLTESCDLEEKNRQGNTPLLAACRASANFQLLIVLIKAGANLEARDKSGKNLMQIIQSKNIFSLQKKKKIETAITQTMQMQKSGGILSFAVTEGYYDLVKLGLSKGENINQKIGKSQDTLLMIALKKKHFFIAKLLIDEKVDITIKNKEGLTVIEVCKQINISETGIKILFGTVYKTDSSSEFEDQFYKNSQVSSDADGLKKPSRMLVEPFEYICPITNEIMKYPVSLIGKDGFIYNFEREFIEQWINKRHTNPISQEPATIDQLKPNTKLGAEIKIYLEEKAVINKSLEIQEPTVLSNCQNIFFQDNTANWGALYNRRISKYAFCFFDTNSLKVASVASKNTYLIGKEIDSERKESRNFSMLGK